VLRVRVWRDERWAVLRIVHYGGDEAGPERPPVLVLEAEVQAEQAVKAEVSEDEH
jgi:hypothetical protein